MTQEGNDTADWITPWIQEFGDKITRFLWTYTHDRDLAQDLAQESFMRLYRFHERHPNRAVHAGWLYTTAHRLAIDVARQARRRPEDLWDGSPDGFPSTPSFEPVVTTRLAVQRTLDRLTRLDRECLWLFYYQGWTVPEISARIGCSESTARTRLYRARRRFAQLWGDDDDDSAR